MTEIIDRLRLLLQDENGEIWSDSELAAYINDGQNEYAERTKCLVNSFQLITEDGEGSLPDDFIDFKYGVNANWNTIYPATWEHLLKDKGEGFETVEGTPTHIYDNLSSDGKYKTYPVMDQGITEATDDSPWGTINIDGNIDLLPYIDTYQNNDSWGVNYGLPGCVNTWGTIITEDTEDTWGVANLNGTEDLQQIILYDESEIYGQTDFGDIDISSDSNIWGIIESSDFQKHSPYGITALLTVFDEAGEIYYSRYPVQGTIEIPDSLALVYYAASKAFELETERQSLKISAGLMEFFDRRINSFRRSSGIKMQHNNKVETWF